MREEYEPLIDEEELDRELLVRTISPYLKIGKKSGDIILQDSFEELNNKSKVLIYLLGCKALSDMGESPGMITPKEISDSAQVNENTTRTVLNRLKSKDLVRKDAASTYSIPNYRLQEVVEEIG